jgi:putative nucleotidyltransferase with HDIG domain
MKEETTIEHKEEEREELLQLLDSSYPLLQKFRDACPGTYKHSQSVSAMIESVSVALGLDVTFMKVVAMYHDIGKINNPKFFTENQLEKDYDPHENLDPWISSQIISRHVSDSVNILLNDRHFSRRMIEIISQHHGTSVIKYFFDRVTNAYPEKDTFRYKCSKPDSIEAAVLMVCDRLEAMTRSLFQNNKYSGDPTEIVNDTINELLEDEQLDNVTIKLGDLKKFKTVLNKELEGMYSKRVDYDKPKDIKNGKEN